MADLPYIQEAQEVKITGQDAVGNTVNYVGADANGNLLVKEFANGTVGGSLPTSALQIAGSDGTNLRALSTDSFGKLNINIANALPAGTNNIGAVDTANTGNSYQPNPHDIIQSINSQLVVDPIGRLETHGSVTTDEGSFRDDFSNTSLNTTLTGTVSFTNGSTIITGVGTSFTTQLTYQSYVKQSTDPESLYIQISYVISDTQAVLSSNYAGITTSGATAVSSSWLTITGTGGSETVANSVIAIGAGTTANSQTFITRPADYLPFNLGIYAAISQRIANQSAYIGFVDNAVAPGKRCWIQFTGTTNTQVNFITASSSAAADTQTTLVTLPNGSNTSSYNLYQIDLSTNQATLSINGTVVAVNSSHVPGPYDVVSIVGGFVNSSTAPASATSLNIDYCFFSNVDRIEIDNDFNGEPLSTQGPAPSGSVAFGNPTRMGGVFNTTVPAYAAGQIGDMQIDSRGANQVTLLDGPRATYSAAVNFTVANRPTDIFTITGSATKTVRVLRIWVSGIQTGISVVAFNLIKRSTRNTGGTSAAVSLTPHDSNSSASTASVFAYTSNPSALGTQVGIIAAFQKLIPPTFFSNSDYGPLLFDFGNRPGQAVVLRGTAQTLSLNLEGVTISGNLFSIVVEWTEE